MSSLASWAIIFAAVLVVFIVVGIIAAKLYTRASQERAFVRTGMGGLKVVLDGGALVLPIFNEIIWVNRNTLRLPVERDGVKSLITKDRLRVDVTAEFYVRVAQSADAVAIAAQTLGERTLQPDQLRSLVEGKFVDSLRSAAAAMTMEELHEKRGDFVQQVKVAVSADLALNGLELESVSLTGLNQTQKSFFDPNNAFDAEGLLKLSKEIETRRKARNDIEQDTAVQIAEKNLSATQRTLTLNREQAEAVLKTDQEIAEATALQEAAIASASAEGRRKGEAANLVANQKIAEQRIDSERAVSESNATRERLVQSADLDARTSVALRTQDKNIEVANKSRDEAAAQAEASKARAAAVTADESIETARQVASAERKKAVTLVSAEETAQEDAIGIRVAATADREAAALRADALRSTAEGERDASVLRAEGTTVEGTALAAALREKNEAQNKLSSELVAQHVKLALLAALPAIIEQSVKPMEHIDSIRIAEVSGLTGNHGAGASGAGGTGSAGGGGLGNELVTAALRYRTAQPVVDALLAEVGIASGGGDMSKLTAAATELAGITGGAGLVGLPVALAPVAEPTALNL